MPGARSRVGSLEAAPSPGAAQFVSGDDMTSQAYEWIAVVGTVFVARQQPNGRTELRPERRVLVLGHRRCCFVGDHPLHPPKMICCCGMVVGVN